jgi:hypothetical protein
MKRRSETPITEGPGLRSWAGMRVLFGQLPHYDITLALTPDTATKALCERPT